MPEQNSKYFDSKPAPYPKSSSTEIESRDIFHRLLNRQFVKGDINVMDKTPNWDGILELLDEQYSSVGKIEVQLKTLRLEFANNPKQQCDQSFFSYCLTAALPVLLVVVDKQNEKAYWRHIDAVTLQEVKQNIRGKSYLLPIPAENFVDGSDQRYIDEWRKRAMESSMKVWNFDSETRKKQELEEKLTTLHLKLQNPVNLPSHALREIHNFLDEYNYILDKEFGSIKQILYPDYWKIGMGVIRYGFGNISFILFPVEYDKSQLLIKEVEKGYDYMMEMRDGNVLLWAGKEDNKDITVNRVAYSYKLVEDQIMGIAGTYNFPLRDVFLADEYLVSFIDTFHQYLNLEKNKETYSLKELKYLLSSVIPMLAAISPNYADWVVKHDHSIDSYDRFRAGESHKKQMAEAINKIKEEYLPKVSVTVVSQRYNIELIHFYIALLESKSFNVVKRQYKTGVRDEKMYNVPLWKTWSREVLWQNVKHFYSQFYKLYKEYIRNHFFNIQQYLQILESDETTTVHVYYSDDAMSYPPHLEIYHLRPELPQEGKILIFRAGDPQCPIDRRKYYEDKDLTCIIEGNRYQVMIIQRQPLDFMFTDSPTYTLMNQTLSGLLKKFFYERKYVRQDHTRTE
jgi:hypothetical protein